MQVTKQRAILLAFLFLVALSPLYVHRIAVGASDLWNRLHPPAVIPPGTVTVGTESGSYEAYMMPGPAPIAPDLNDNTQRVAALMARMPTFEQVTMPPGIRWYRYRPAWLVDTAMETTSRQIWITFWPKTESSHPPEYLGQLYGGVLRHRLLPLEPYYDLTLVYHTGPVPVVDGDPIDPWRHVVWGVLPNGSVENAALLPPSLRGRDSTAICKEGDPRQPVALYGLLPNGRWQPVLTWRAWESATLGIWHYSPNYPVECAGRFAGYFWVWYESARQGAIFRVGNGTIAPFTAARAYLVTDHTILLWDGNQLIEAHAP